MSRPSKTRTPQPMVIFSLQLPYGIAIQIQEEASARGFVSRQALIREALEHYLACPDAREGSE